jgi:hypothetical protein
LCSSTEHNRRPLLGYANCVDVTLIYRRDETLIDFGFCNNQGRGTETSYWHRAFARYVCPARISVETCRHTYTRARCISEMYHHVDWLETPGLHEVLVRPFVPSSVGLWSVGYTIVLAPNVYGSAFLHDQPRSGTSNSDRPLGRASLILSFSFVAVVVMYMCMSCLIFLVRYSDEVRIVRVEHSSNEVECIWLQRR